MTTSTAAAPSRYRLPTTVRPSHYEIELDVDLAGAVFTGWVAARVEVAEPVSEVVVNADELVIAEAWVEAGGRRVGATVSFDAETERATFALEGTLPAGPATVHARFTGVLNDKLVGFYRTTFKDADGVERTAAATQFEAPHARMAFPCWDEPEFKASFGVTLVVPEGELAISNAAEVERTPTGDGRTRYRFADTMVMSTYLVAFVVGPFEATAPVDVAGTPLRVVYPRGQGHLVGYGLEAGEFGLRFFEDYYGIGYPGDKLDLVAVPDFAFGAMENLGCITFREVLLLVDPTTVTQPELQRVADVIFHELAHMWFGDLVTMKWWNGLWLNEAFATFMEMKATDAFRPEWQRWVDFGLSRTMAFDTDALASTRPIEYEVVSPADAEGMFDVLTYEKGAAVLRMVEQYLGEDAFRAGVRRYLEQHSYANTETTDLWDALEAETGQPVRGMADSWIFQGGFPLVTASLEGSALHLAQERFRYLDDGGPGGGGPGGGGAGTAGARWKVPVIVRVGGREQRALLEDDG
ncbi:MAG: M1 family peptidase, partial [Acidimicrobiia bacterium]|nr:M1 family peptidase [Acidimicrobiia bacterium]